MSGLEARVRALEWKLRPAGVDALEARSAALEQALARLQARPAGGPRACRRDYRWTVTGCPGFVTDAYGVTSAVGRALPGVRVLAVRGTYPTAYAVLAQGLTDADGVAAFGYYGPAADSTVIDGSPRFAPAVSDGGPDCDAVYEHAADPLPSYPDSDYACTAIAPWALSGRFTFHEPVFGADVTLDFDPDEFYWRGTVLVDFPGGTLGPITCPARAGVPVTFTLVPPDDIGRPTRIFADYPSTASGCPDAAGTFASSFDWGGEITVASGGLYEPTVLAVPASTTACRLYSGNPPALTITEAYPYP